MSFQKHYGNIHWRPIYLESARDHTKSPVRQYN